VERARRGRGLDRFKRILNRSRERARKYGFAPCTATYREIRDAFTGKCDACGVDERELKRKLCVDHDHKTGEFRGWLCNRCNTALGLLGDSEKHIWDLLEYITS